MRRLTLATAVVVLLSFAPPAIAESPVYNGPGATDIPADQTSARHRPHNVRPDGSFENFDPMTWGDPSGVSTLSTRYDVVTTGGWSTIRSAPSSYSLGLAANYWTFDASDYSLGFYWGYLWGNFNHCGWIAATNLANARTGPASCGGGSALAPSSFAQRVNCVGCSPSGVRTDPVNWNEQCGNVKPWLAANELCSDPVRWVAPNSLVYWRYVSRDCNWVMVLNDPGAPDGTGQWVFMHRTALQGINCSSGIPAPTSA